MTQELILAGHSLLLLPQRAVYIDSLRALLVSDLHLGKAETFQRQGLPIPRQVNQATLDRLQALCDTYHPQCLWVLGDLFHSAAAHGDGLLEEWQTFLEGAGVRAEVVLGNHDRPLAQRLSRLPGTCHPQSVVVENLCFSHTPPRCLRSTHPLRPYPSLFAVRGAGRSTAPALLPLATPGEPPDLARLWGIYRGPPH